jgi:hypothetical protein
MVDFWGGFSRIIEPSSREKIQRHLERHIREAPERERLALATWKRNMEAQAWSRLYWWLRRLSGNV